MTADSSSEPSRSSLAIADAHSTSVAHHTSIDGSSAASACAPAVVGSFISNGTTADASQNFIDCPAGRREARERRSAFLQTRRAGRKQRVGHRGSRWSHDALANEAAQSAVVIGMKPVDGFQACDRASAIDDQDREPPFTLSINALRLFLASVILAFFMMARIA